MCTCLSVTDIVMLLPYMKRIKDLLQEKLQQCLPLLPTHHAELARTGPANEPDKSKTSNSFWMFEEPWILEKLEFKLRQQLFNIKLP